MKQIFDNANKGGLQLLTSTISIVEVDHTAIEQKGRSLDAGEQAKIDGLWTNRTAIQLAEFSRLTADAARSLIRDAHAKGLKLKTMDSIHLATAKRLGVADFHTYDEKLRKYGAEIGCDVKPPDTIHVTFI